MIKQSLNEIFILFLYVLLLSKLPSWVWFSFSHVLMQRKTLKGVDPLFFVLLLSFLVCNSLVFALKEVRLVIWLLFIDTGSIKRHVGKLAFRKHLLIRSDKFVLVNFMLAYLPFPSALMLSESGHYVFPGSAPDIN